MFNFTKSVVILITFWNRWNITQRCIDSIRKYTDMSDVDLVVVDDFSDEDVAVKWGKDSSENVVRMDRNYHHNAIVRKVMDVTKDNPKIKYVCALNNDILVTKNWLSNLLVCMENDPTIALMGCKDNMDYHNYQNFPVPDEFKPMYNGWAFGDDTKFQEYIDREFYAKRKPNVCVHVETIDGVVMLFRNSLINTIGNLDPHYDDYAADSEFFIRLGQKGYKLSYCLSSFVYHTSGGGGGKYEAFLKYYGKPLAKAAEERIQDLINKYKIDIRQHGRSSPKDRENILRMEREMVKL